MGKSTPGRGTSKCHGSEASVRKTEEAGVAGAQKGGEECRRTERGRWAGMEGPRGHCKNFETYRSSIYFLKLTPVSFFLFLKTGDML